MWDFTREFLDFEINKVRYYPKTGIMWGSSCGELFGLLGPKYEQSRTKRSRQNHPHLPTDRTLSAEISWPTCGNAWIGRWIQSQLLARNRPATDWRMPTTLT